MTGIEQFNQIFQSSGLKLLNVRYIPPSEKKPCTCCRELTRDRIDAEGKIFPFCEKCWKFANKNPHRTIGEVIDDFWDEREKQGKSKVLTMLSNRRKRWKSK